MIYNRHIGMYTIDRSPKTCIFSSDFCKKTCYNIKLYKGLFGNKMRARDKYNDLYWDCLTGPILREVLLRKRERGKRIRFCTRGEAINNIDDIFKVRNICIYNPDTIFWLPTRAYKRKRLRIKIQELLFTLPNLRIQASIDIETDHNIIKELKNNRWSTMFYGDNNAIQNRILCPKTWLFYRTLKGYCNVCSICFGDLNKPKHIHLRQH